MDTLNNRFSLFSDALENSEEIIHNAAQNKKGIENTKISKGENRKHGVGEYSNK